MKGWPLVSLLPLLLLPSVDFPRLWSLLLPSATCQREDSYAYQLMQHLCPHVKFYFLVLVPSSVFRSTQNIIDVNDASKSWYLTLASSRTIPGHVLRGLHHVPRWSLSLAFAKSIRMPDTLPALFRDSRGMPPGPANYGCPLVYSHVPHFQLLGL